MSNITKTDIWNSQAEHLVELIGEENCLLDNEKIYEHIKEIRNSDNSGRVEKFLQMDLKMFNGTKMAAIIKYDILNPERKSAP